MGLVLLSGCGSKVGAWLGKSEAKATSVPATISIQNSESKFEVPFSDQISETRTLSSSTADQACGIQEDGKTLCWGYDVQNDNRFRREFYNEPSIMVAISRGVLCAIQAKDKAISCAGDPGNEILTKMPAELWPIHKIAVGLRHACAILENGFLRCWGFDHKAVNGIPTHFKARSVATGTLHTCAADEAGRVSCWGSNQLEQLAIPSSLGTVKVLFAKEFYSCALTETGAIDCWGRFDEELAEQLEKVKQNGARFKQLALGQDFLCGIDEKNEVQCLGTADCGATDVPQGLKALAISAGKSHACAVAMDGRLVCWGSFQCEQGSAKAEPWDPEMRLKK